MTAQPVFNMREWYQTLWSLLKFLLLSQQSIEIKHSRRHSIALSLKHVFCCCCFFQNTVFPRIPGVSWTILKRELLSNQCISYLSTAVGVFFFKFKVAKNNSFHTTGNLLYLKGEYQILLYDFDGKTEGKKLWYTQKFMCLDLLS